MFTMVVYSFLRSPTCASNSIKYWIEKELSPPISPSGMTQNNTILKNETMKDSTDSKTSDDTSLIGEINV